MSIMSSLRRKQTNFPHRHSADRNYLKDIQSKIEVIRYLRRIKFHLNDLLATEIINYIIFCHNNKISVNKYYVQNLRLDSSFNPPLKSVSL